MITEDYVSIETAKLLKEKGFNECSRMQYNIYDEEIGEYNAIDRLRYPEKYIYAPTIQMAMKWLRNIHDIVCSVGLFTDLPEMPPYWSFNILNQSTANVMYEAFDVKCETYEEACEAAIKYCLENLI